MALPKLKPGYKLGKRVRDPKTQAEMAQWRKRYVWDTKTQDWYEQKPVKTEKVYKKEYEIGTIRINSRTKEKEILQETSTGNRFWRKASPEEIRKQPLEPIPAIGSGVLPQAGILEPTVVFPGQPDFPRKPGELSKLTEETDYNQLIEDYFKDSPLWEYVQYLDEDSKKLLGLSLFLQEQQSEEYNDRMRTALTMAKEQADPYFKEKIRLFEDTVARSLGIIEADLASRERSLARSKKEIEEDLTYNKEQLTTEQAAELARRGREYDIQLENVRETMAQRGLSFSTRRSEAEERLGVEQKDIIESTQRRYAREQRALGVGAERALADIAQEVEDLRRTMGAKKEEVVRGAERYLGTSGLQALGKLPDVGQYLLGGVTGGIKEEKAADILTRSQALLTADGF